MPTSNHGQTKILRRLGRPPARRIFQLVGCREAADRRLPAGQVQKFCLQSRGRKSPTAEAYWAYVPAKDTRTVNQQIAGRTGRKSAYRLDSLAVDAACSGNPGDMEYRGVHIPNRTGNISEWARCPTAPTTWANSSPWYTPWPGSNRQNSPNTPDLFRLPQRPALGQSRPSAAPNWPVPAATTKFLSSSTAPKNGSLLNRVTNPVLKWNTEEWGEIPADYGRK
jgi:ribonuclease HI